MLSEGKSVVDVVATTAAVPVTTVSILHTRYLQHIYYWAMFQNLANPPSITRARG